MDNSAYNLVLSTVPSIDEARYIARDLVQKKLVACVNIVPDLTSVYEWDGELHEDRELLLVMKTRTDLLDSLIERIVEIHGRSLFPWPVNWTGGVCIQRPRQ